MSSLEVLDLSGNNLEAFASVAVFAGLSNLTRLLLSDNQLTVLPGGLFEAVGDQLKHVEIGGNDFPTTCPAGSSAATVGGAHTCQSPGDCSVATGGEVTCSCPPGYHQPGSDTDPCESCSPGKAQPLAGQASCELCGAGTYAESAGATECKACDDPATYCPAGTSTPRNVATGFFSLPADGNRTKQLPCPLGSQCV